MGNRSDIYELYGFDPSDERVKDRLVTQICPFTRETCSKIERGSSQPTGVCSVTVARSPSIICENRFLGDSMATLRLVIAETFGAARLALSTDYHDPTNMVVAYRDIVAIGKSKVKFGWILQNHDHSRRKTSFAAAEIVSATIKGSYRSALDGYRNAQRGGTKSVPPSEHTLDMTFVAKRLIPELIQKGMILSGMDNCRGNYLLVTESVLQKMETLLPGVPERAQISSGILSIRAYVPDSSMASGVRVTRAMNISVKDMASAFYARADEKARDRLDAVLKRL